jgi:hypothetical protein
VNVDIHVETDNKTLQQGADSREFLHRLIENAFSWALQDCNYLSPKYMDRLLAATREGMTPEAAAFWNATAREQQKSSTEDSDKEPEVPIKTSIAAYPSVIF